MRQPVKPFALCGETADSHAPLMPGGVYRIIPDPKAARDDGIQMIDESGEDSLCRKSHFVCVDFLKAATKKILSLQTTAA